MKGLIDCKVQFKPVIASRIKLSLPAIVNVAIVLSSEVITVAFNKCDCKQ